MGLEAEELSEEDGVFCEARFGQAGIHEGIGEGLYLGLKPCPRRLDPRRRRHEALMAAARSVVAFVLAFPEAGVVGKPLIQKTEVAVEVEGGGQGGLRRGEASLEGGDPDRHGIENLEPLFP